MRRQQLSLNNNQMLIALAIIAILVIIIIYSEPTLYLGRIIGMIIGFTFHEFAHAYIAVKLGDRTPQFQGRLTLDPRSHIEPLGIIMAVFAGFGWARPVQVNPGAFYPQERQGMMIVALAGPVANLIIAIILGVILRLFLAITNVSLLNFFILIWLTVIYFNLILLFFNLIPLPPLDGWKILLGVLPSESAASLMQYEQQASWILFGLILIGLISPHFQPISDVISPPATLLYRWIMGF